MSRNGAAPVTERLVAIGPIEPAPAPILLHLPPGLVVELGKIQAELAALQARQGAILRGYLYGVGVDLDTQNAAVDLDAYTCTVTPL